MGDQGWSRIIFPQPNLDEFPVADRAVLREQIAWRTRWHRRFMLAFLGLCVLAVVSILAYRLMFGADRESSWVAYLGVLAPLALVVTQQVSRVAIASTNRLLRAYRQRDLRTEIATLIAPY